MTDDNYIILTEQGETLTDCEAKIQTKHSINYEILKTRKILKRYGLFHLKEKELVEISFRLINKPGFKTGNNPIAFSNIPPIRTENSISAVNIKTEKVSDFEDEKKKILEKTNVKLNPQIQELAKEVMALRKDLEQGKISSDSETHSTINTIEKWLDNNEFSMSFIKNIVERMKKEFSFDQLEDFDSIQEQVVDWIGESIQIADINYSEKPQIIVIVGPTGVGKTTTIAKLGAHYKLGLHKINRYENRNGSEVLFITIDTYKIEAKKQIEKYGEHLNIPVKIVEIPKDMTDILEMNCYGIDYILIDTIGFSPKDYKLMAAIKELLDIKGYPVDTYLALSASTKYSDLKEVMQQAEIYSYNSVVITKSDETNHIGNIISAVVEKNKKIAYITDGQNVPKNIEQATIVSLLMRLTDFRINKDRIEQKFGFNEE